MPISTALQVFIDQIYKESKEEPDTIEQHRLDWAAALSQVPSSAETNTSSASKDVVVTKDLLLRIYQPESNDVLPIILYYPGGAFVYSSLDSHDHLCRIISERCNAVVVSVKTRVAPEFSALECTQDAYTAVHWCIECAHQFNANPEQLIVSGDSSGGNFAALSALYAAKNNLSNIKAQVLIVPATDLSRSGQSHKKFDKGYLLDRVDWFYDFYAPKKPMRISPKISPLFAKIPNDLARAQIILAQFDPLSDDARLYHKHLKAAGVASSLHEVPTIHGMHLFEPLINTIDNATIAMRPVIIEELTKAVEYVLQFGNNTKLRCRS